MANNDASARREGAGSDWGAALQVVSRLAAAHELAIHDVGVDLRAPAPQTRAGSAAAAPVDPDQLARALAEIENASAALRRSEPALEAWMAETAVVSDSRSAQPVWMLIAAVWLLASLVVTGATGAIFYLLG